MPGDICIPFLHFYQIAFDLLIESSFFPASCRAKTRPPLWLEVISRISCRLNSNSISNWFVANLVWVFWRPPLLSTNEPLVSHFVCVCRPPPPHSAKCSHIYGISNYILLLLFIANKKHYWQIKREKKPVNPFAASNLTPTQTRSLARDLANSQAQNRYWPTWSALLTMWLSLALAAPYAHLWKATTSQSVGHLGARFSRLRAATGD